MLIRTRLDEILDELDNAALLRIYDVAKIYQLNRQSRSDETVSVGQNQLTHYLRAQEILAEVEGNLSDDIIALREDRL